MLSNDVAIREAEVADMPQLLELADLDSRPAFRAYSSRNSTSSFEMLTLSFMPASYHG